MESPFQPLAYSVRQAAAKLGISTSFAYDLAARGELPTVRIGSRLVVPADKLRDMLAGETDA